MMWWNYGWGWGGWLGMTLLMLVFWGALIWLIAMLVGNGSGKDAPPPRRAEDVLAERFARGEIGQAASVPAGDRAGRGDREPAAEGGRATRWCAGDV